MITQNRKYLSLLLLILLPLAFFLRSNISEKFEERARQAKQKKELPTHQSNATSFEHASLLDETHEGAPRISQCSMQYGGNFDVTYERGLRTHIRYGEKWGYPTHFLRQDIVGHGDTGDGMYNKLLYLLTVMVNEQTKPFGKRSEWIVWFDADSVLVNDQIPFTVFLPPQEGDLFRDINILVSRDWIGFNAGVFIIRVCEWSINSITDAISLPRLRPEIDLPFREQDSLKWVFNLPENKKHRIYQPRHWWNQYDEYYSNMGEHVMKGTINIHFPGMGGARPDTMGRWLDKIDNHPEEVSIPLKNTTYPAEIEAYWSRLRSAADLLKRTEEYKNKLKEEHHDAYVADDGKIPDNMAKAEKEVHEVIEEWAYDKQKLREAVLKLDGAVRDAKKDVDDFLKKQEVQKKEKQEEEEQKRKEEEEKRKQQEEEKKMKEGEKKQEDEERKKKQQEQEASQGGGSDGGSSSSDSSSNKDDPSKGQSSSDDKGSASGSDEQPSKQKDLEAKKAAEEQEKEQEKEKES